MSPSLTTFLFEAANFVAVAALLAWLFFKPVRDALRGQREHVEQQAREAERQLQAAEQLRGELAAERQELSEELSELRKQASEAARHDADKLIHQARIRMAKEREMHVREIATLKRAEAAALARAVARATRDSVTRLLGEINGPELHRALVQAATRQLTGDPHAQDVTVESAEPLDGESLRLLAESLQLAPDAIRQRVNPDLLSGVRVQTPHGLVDVSVSGLANFAESELAARLQENQDTRHV